jgi:hypothetical protein
MWQVWRKGKLHTGSLFGNLRESDRLDDLDVDKKIILKQVFKKRDGETWTEFIWLRIRKVCGML